MSNVQSQIRFLRRLEKYATEKPYFALSGPGIDRDPEKITNLEFHTETVEIQDIRPRIADFKIEECGFQAIHHPASLLKFENLNDVAVYQQEVQALLKDLFKAEHVVTWDFRTRKNETVPNLVFDINDKLQVDTSVKEAHNDYTFMSGPIGIKRQLVENGLGQYLRPGYRFRMVNLWRSILPVVEDGPLAVCDFRSLEPSDVMACDRIRPDRTGESFYVHFNENQKWCYLNSMTSDEALVFLTYDSAPGNQARFCPHCSFAAPLGDKGVPVRHSVETRSVVITAT